MPRSGECRVTGSSLVAALDADDPDHAPCAGLLARRIEPRVIPAPVLPEVDYFCTAKAFIRLLEDVERGAFVIEDLRPADYPRIAELLARYADLRVGFIDAAVLAIVERLGEPKLATLDRCHFGVMRPRHVDALQLLPAR